jgi:hypothetical protein
MMLGDDDDAMSMTATTTTTKANVLMGSWVGVGLPDHSNWVTMMVMQWPTVDILAISS